RADDTVAREQRHADDGADVVAYHALPQLRREIHARLAQHVGRRHDLALGDRPAGHALARAEIEAADDVGAGAVRGQLAQPAPLAVHDAVVVRDATRPEPLTMARDPPGRAQIVRRHAAWRIARDLRLAGARQGHRARVLVGQPEGHEAHADERRRRLADRAQQLVEIERARHLLVDGGERADALGLHALGLVEPGVAQGDTRLCGEQAQRLLLLGVR